MEAAEIRTPNNFTTLRFVSQKEGTFGAYIGERPEPIPNGQWEQLDVARGVSVVRLVRLAEGRGYVINEGPRTVHITYVHKGVRVGPRTDYIAAGACKELGIGRNVEWRIEEV